MVKWFGNEMVTERIYTKIQTELSEFYHVPVWSNSEAWVIMTLRRQNDFLPGISPGKIEIHPCHVRTCNVPHFRYCSLSGDFNRNITVGTRFGNEKPI